MLVSEALTEIRVELDDELSTRWTNDKLIALIKKAVRRLAGILAANDIDAGKKSATITTVSGTQVYTLPTDFMRDIGLFRQDTGVPLIRVPDARWETLPSTTPVSSYYAIRTASSGMPAAVALSLLIKGTPDAALALTLAYWPRLDGLTFTTSASLPYNGLFDDLIMEYVSLRAKNIDEMNVTTDAQLLQEMENKVLSAFSSTAVKKMSAKAGAASAGGQG
jgi:hypothetical protein